MIKLSIITINYKNAAGLQKTIDSVFSQTYREFEYIIIDGGSKDGSKEIIEFHKDKLSYWVSEKDSGIYNAMNKGISKAEGEYLLFLNSGDFLIDEHSLSHFFLTNCDEDIICGDILINEKGKYWVKSAPDTLSFEYFTYDTLPHQSALIKRTLFDKVGLYNEELKFVADWKFYLDALCKFNATYKHISATVCEYNYDGISSIPENATALHKEREEIIEREYPLFYEDYKKFKKAKAELRNFKSSRAHSILAKLMHWRIYKIFKITH